MLLPVDAFIYVDFCMLLPVNVSIYVDFACCCLWMSLFMLTLHVVTCECLYLC